MAPATGRRRRQARVLRATKAGDGRMLCHGTAPLDAHRVMLCTDKRGRGLRSSLRPELHRALSSRQVLTLPRWNLCLRSTFVPEFGSRATSRLPCRLARGRTIVRVVPGERLLAKAFAQKPLPSEPRRTNRRPASARLRDERNASEPRSEGAPVPDSKDELPPVIRRAELVAFALVSLLVISIVAVLYVARAFFLPITMAFIVGTMLSPAASLLERYRIPRAVAAVLIVTAVGAGVAFMVGLIASPVMEWSTRLPELGALLKDKLHVFDRPLALWQELQSMLGGSDTLAAFQMPKFEWVQPTLEFLSPTFAEFLLFIATLILFIASWKDLRRAWS